MGPAPAPADTMTARCAGAAGWDPGVRFEPPGTLPPALAGSHPLARRASPCAAWSLARTFTGDVAGDGYRGTLDLDGGPGLETIASSGETTGLSGSLRCRPAASYSSTCCTADRVFEASGEPTTKMSESLGALRNRSNSAQSTIHLAGRTLAKASSTPAVRPRGRPLPPLQLPLLSLPQGHSPHGSDRDAELDPVARSAARPCNRCTTPWSARMKFGGSGVVRERAALQHLALRADAMKRPGSMYAICQAPFLDLGH